MVNYAMFNYDYLFSDHMAKVSNEAKLYFVKLMFMSNCGFVANPISVLDSMGYDKSIMQELINNGELLTLPNRSEVFIASFYIHNHNYHIYSWMKTPFAQYWKGKLFIKKNGVATFKPQQEQAKHEVSVKQIEKETEQKENISYEDKNADDPNEPVKEHEWNDMLGQIV